MTLHIIARSIQISCPLEDAGRLRKPPKLDEPLAPAAPASRSGGATGATGATEATGASKVLTSAVNPRGPKLPRLHHGSPMQYIHSACINVPHKIQPWNIWPSNSSNIIVGYVKRSKHCQFKRTSSDLPRFPL